MTGLNRKGATLVELMIVVGILGLVLSIIYGIYTYSIKATESHRLTSELQMDTRNAIDYMSREFSQLGYDVAMSNCPSGPGQDDGYPSYTTFGNNDSGPRIVRASGSQIVFTYKDLSAKENETDGGTVDNNLRQFRLVHYFQDGGAVKRKTYRWDNEDPSPNVWSAQGDAETLIDSVAAFSLGFYNATGDKLGTGDLSYSERCKIRKIKVSLNTQTSKKDPLTNEPKTYKLSTEVFLPNMGTSVVTDTTPPSAPTNLSLSDPKICGMINATWTPVSAPDIAGYTLEVTSSTTSSYTSPADSASALLGKNRIASDTGVWSFAIENDYPATVRMRSFDTAGNVSNWTSPVSITPQADAPSQPTGVDATAGTDSIDIFWNTNPETDVKGYNVFRRAKDVGSFAFVNFTNTPSYTNAITPQERCTTFEYKVNAATACDTSLTSSQSDSAYGDAAYAGGLTDVPSDGITNTTARDSVAPAAPTGPAEGGAVSSLAGYKRNFLNWNNPGDADLAYVAIRYNHAPAPPGYPLSVVDGFPVEDINVAGVQGRVNETTVASGITYENFAPDASGLSVTHTGTTINEPSLVDDHYYDYALFAVDKCGNSSSGAAVTALTRVNQCGEETSGPAAGAPRWTGDNANFKLQDGTGCSTNYGFTWSKVDDTYPSGDYDLAGYYVFKRVSSGSFSYTSLDTKASGLLTQPAGNPDWTTLSSSGYPSTDDNPNNVGKTFRYYVIPIDCYSETSLSSNPWAWVVNAAHPSPLQSNALTLKPGRIIFNKPKPAQLANYPLPADPYVASGEMSFDAFGKPTGSPTYMHNTVYLYFYNTSMGPVTLNGFNLSWDRDAYLSEVRRVDTNQCLFGTCLGGGVRLPSPVTISPGITLNGISEDNLTCPSSPCYLKLKLVFTDSAGNITSNQDMRYNDSGTQMTIDVSNLSYTKTYASVNETSANGTPSSSTPGTNNISCTHSEPMVTLTIDDDITVPFGPTTEVSQLYFGTMNAPPQTTTGSNISAAYNVDVRTQITDNSGSGLSDKYLYYAVTKQNVTSPTSNLNFYSVVPMNLVGGSIYNGVIPKQKDKRVWYFVIAKDNQGNWDRDPEMQNPSQFTAYIYDQDNPCLNTPNPPTGVSLTLDATQTTSMLSWTAPTTNTDGSTINDLAGYNIYRTRDSLPYPVTPTATVYAPNTTYQEDISSLYDGVYKYKIVAFDECSPTPVNSTDSFSNQATKTCPLTPSMPTNVQISLSADKNTLTCTWVNSKNPDGTPLNDLSTLWTWLYYNGLWYQQPACQTVGNTTCSANISTVPAGAMLQCAVASVDMCIPYKWSNYTYSNILFK